MGPFFFLVVAQGSPTAAGGGTAASTSIAVRIGISLTIAFLLLCLVPAT